MGIPLATYRYRGTAGLTATLIIGCSDATASPDEPINIARDTTALFQTEIVRSPVLPACLGPPLVVAVGATYDFNVDLVGGDPTSNLAPRYTTTDLNGEYRLLWDGAFSTYDGNTGTGAPVPEASRLSNDFLIRVVER